VSVAVVLQASGPNALGIIRGLARARIPVVATDHDPGALGLRSRYAAAHVLPDPIAEPVSFVDGLLQLGERIGERPVLFATHDDALSAIGPREAEVDALFRRPWSPWQTLEPILDKSHQHAVARRIGFPIPETFEPASAAELEQIIDHLRFPVVLKPREQAAFRARFRAQVLEANGPDELRRRFSEAKSFRLQISEVIPGGDEQLWTLGSYRNADGVPIGSFTGHKLRQWPPRFGTARSAEAGWDPELAMRCHALLDALDYHGISQVEVKRDPRDGRDVLIEVNPRSWLWISLATAVGVNLPALCFSDALGLATRPRLGHRSGKRWTLAAKHLVASPREIRRGQWTATQFARSIRPPIVDGVIDPRDPRPTLAMLERRTGRLRRG
jgi:D-aspartate ligase